ARPPHDPAWSPHISGNPEPAAIGIVDPATIVKGNRAPLVVGIPRPAEFARVVPMPAIVGTEVGIDRTRLPDVAPPIAMLPAPIMRKLVMEISRVDTSMMRAPRGIARSRHGRVLRGCVSL